MKTDKTSIQLRRPCLEDKTAILEMISEFHKTDGGIEGLWNLSNENIPYEYWLESNQLQEMGLLQNKVPAIQLVACENDEVIGFLNVRLRLNDNLLKRGGHIGYSVRPSKRRKGKAKEMLKLGIKFAHTKNINPILVTCHRTNIASRLVILANGGVLENTLEGFERYWIGRSHE